MLTPQILANAKKLRRHQTDAELRLWYHLRNRRFANLKFRRQVPIGNYIVDFVCAIKKVIIELDGGQHAIVSCYDEARTQFLQQKGYRIVRFWNNDVLINTDGVLSELAAILNVYFPLTLPSPRS